jgi:Asp-tRNA(Asn)/Glu-tRNA(Gln) amidotransferase A subunit family amidase
MNPEDLLLGEAADAIRTGTLSSVEYVEALFRRMDRIEPLVQAWTTVDRSSVLDEASRCDSEARRGVLRGPLHGVPVGIKDIFYTAKLRTTMGSALFKDFVPDVDADAVAKLKQAGAIVLGKTVTTVFANLDPGPTRNPWNIEHTPGGSSSGSAAAVAARMCPVAIGTQTVGSVGRPAAFCGVASLLPSQRRISLRHVFPLAWSLDHVGVFARAVDDLERMLDVLTESVVSPPRFRVPFRIGVVRQFFYRAASAETRASLDRLVNALPPAEFIVEEVRPPAIFEIHPAILRTILRSETASIHERLFADHRESYGPKLRALIETGMLVEAADYVRARRLRRRYQREMEKLFGKFNALLTPAATGPAPAGIAATGDPVMNGPWTLSDFPTMTLPYALGAEGLPLGVQLTGPPLEERSLLDIGRALERVVQFRTRPLL